jgi:hypothetical protein
MSNGPNHNENEMNRIHAMEKGPYIYELFSIMVHSGSASGGHYYAYSKDFKKGDWFCFNDQSVSRVSEFLSSSGLHTHSLICTVSSVSWLALPMTLLVLMLNNLMKSMGPYFYTCFCVRGIYKVPCLVVPAYSRLFEWTSHNNCGCMYTHSAELCNETECKWLTNKWIWERWSSFMC